MPLRCRHHAHVFFRLRPPPLATKPHFLCCREYLPFAQQQQQLYPQHAAPGLGFLAIIAFPHYFAASFGELGSPRWALWGNKLATLGIPVSCCFLDSLSYLHGLPTANSATT